MEIEEFKLERIQSLYENTVEFNLSDSGVHPMSLNDLLSGAEMRELQALELGYGWTNGAVSLRERIAALYEGRTADEIIVTNGSAEANFLLVMSLLNPGDEIIVFTPNYLQIWGWARALGVNAKAVGHDGDAGWQPKLAELEAAISANTRLITICHPNNPTGAVMPPEGMRELVRIAAAHDIYLHADEVYKGLELHGPEGGSFLDICDKAIVTNGVSKALALPGLRIGWLAGPAEDVSTAWKNKDYTSITTSAISEYVAERVLKPQLRSTILKRSRKILRRNLEMLLGWIDAHAGLVSLVPPQAGGMAFVRYHFEANSTELVHRLRDERGVLLLPGDVYGLDGYFRVGIGSPRGHLEPGLERIGDFIRKNYRRTQ